MYEEPLLVEGGGKIPLSFLLIKPIPENAIFILTCSPFLLLFA